MDAEQALSASLRAASPATLPKSKGGGDLRQLVAAGYMRFIIGFDESREYIDSVASLTRIPRSPGWLLGAFSSDSSAVPLVDVSAWAHQTEPTGWRSHG